MGAQGSFRQARLFLTTNGRRCRSEGSDGQQGCGVLKARLARLMADHPFTPNPAMAAALKDLVRHTGHTDSEVLPRFRSSQRRPRACAFPQEKMRSSPQQRVTPRKKGASGKEQAVKGRLAPYTRKGLVSLKEKRILEVSQLSFLKVSAVRSTR